MKSAFDRDGVVYAASGAVKGDPAAVRAGAGSADASGGPWFLRRGSQMAAAILAGIAVIVQRAWGAQIAR
jgi:hypothetical protein